MDLPRCCGQTGARQAPVAYPLSADRAGIALPDPAPALHAWPARSVCLENPSIYGTLSAIDRFRSRPLCRLTGADGACSEKDGMARMTDAALFLQAAVGPRRLDPSIVVALIADFFAERTGATIHAAGTAGGSGQSSHAARQHTLLACSSLSEISARRSAHCSFAYPGHDLAGGDLRYLCAVAPAPGGQARVPLRCRSTRERAPRPE